MIDIKERPKMVERALLVAVYESGGNAWEAQSLLDELHSLVDTLGVPVIEKVLVKVPSIHPKLVVGTGKADEIVALAKSLQIDVIIFDNELTPAQQRNWEALSEVCVIDRQEVIIDIFAQRAHTREARLQVDLARLEYSLPRLKRAWTHLDRQGGGIGARGEGERQIETDRRLVRKRIDKLKEEIAKVRANRATQRKRRERIPIPRAAIVGYTNAGKSSLLRRLTSADVLVEDKLFATLDTTTRKILLPTGQKLLLTDTVGFIRNLPHDLVDAFKATLEEATLADFLIHVVDASHPNAEDFHATTLRVLEELDADCSNILTVFNKIDAAPDEATLHVLRRRFPQAIFISVHTGEGLEALVAAMSDRVSDRIAEIELLVPHTRHDIIAMLHRDGHILEQRYHDDGIHVIASTPPKLAAALAAWRVKHDDWHSDQEPAKEAAQVR